jgi:uncharacterized protein with beta-barrel porin domain
VLRRGFPCSPSFQAAYFLLAILFFIAERSAQAQMAFGSRSNVDGTLHQINLQTGATTQIGNIGFFAEGIAFDPNQQLFGVVQGNPGTLITINTTTGAGTAVGSTGVLTDEDGFAFDNSGLGYMANSDNNFYSVNPTTGAATLIGAMGTNVEALAWRNGVFYGVGTGNNLVIINGTTGVATVVGPLVNATGDNSGLDFDADGTLWGVNAAGQIYTIDPTTGLATVVAATLGGFESMAIGFFNVSSNNFVALATTPNQASVARALNTLSPQDPLIVALNALPAGSIPNALEQLSPEELDALSRIVEFGSRTQVLQLGNRMEELRSGARGLSVSALNIIGPDGYIQDYHLAGLDMTTLPSPRGDSDASLNNHPWGFFAAGNGQFGDVDGDEFARGYEFDAGGITLGTDYRLGERWVAGAYAGYAHVDTDIDADGGNIVADSARFGLYSTAWLESGTYFETILGGGYHEYDSERSVLGSTAAGNTDAAEFIGSLAAGHEWKCGKWRTGPRGSVTYDRIELDGFTESGSIGPLVIEDRVADSFRSHLGLAGRIRNPMR